jgi:DNA modification methylase
MKKQLAIAFGADEILEENNLKYSLEEAIKNIKKIEWQSPPYEKQSWGHPLHRIGPYVGRIKPAFCHALIKYLTKKGQTILDPFCGIGTIPLEASLMQRNSIGFDLNPYAIHIATAKMTRNFNVEEKIEYVNSIKINTKKISIKKIPEWVKNYYNEETLKEILFLLKLFQEQKEDFLYGCLLAISQGHRPGHLSKPCGWTLPYKPRPDDPGEYREVKPRLIDKILRNYQELEYETGTMNIKLQDSRAMPLADKTIDAIISSPPYFNTLDYVNSHRLRLAICGHYEEIVTKDLKQSLIQHKKTYLQEMELVINEMRRVLKPSGLICFVVGDHFTENNKTINTSEKLVEIFEKKKFKLIENIEDKIPINKSVQKKTQNVKSERIIVLKKYG